MQYTKEVSSDFCADAKIIYKKVINISLFAKEITVEPKIIAKIGSLWIKYPFTNNFCVAVFLCFVYNENMSSITSKYNEFPVHV